MNTLWPLSKNLLKEILADRTTDRFVCALIWERLDYKPANIADKTTILVAGPNTPDYWRQKFLEAPQVNFFQGEHVELLQSIGF